MRSWLSRVLIVCLVGSAVTVTAEEGDDQLTDWSRVRKLAPGTEIFLSVRDSQPRERVVVGADDSSVTTLNLTTP